MLAGATTKAPASVWTSPDGLLMVPEVLQQDNKKISDAARRVIGGGGHFWGETRDDDEVEEVHTEGSSLFGSGGSSWGLSNISSAPSPTAPGSANTSTAVSGDASLLAIQAAGRSMAAQLRMGKPEASWENQFSV